MPIADCSVEGKKQHFTLLSISFFTQQVAGIVHSEENEVSKWNEWISAMVLNYNKFYCFKLP